jgi:hypothetical protein
VSHGEATEATLTCCAGERDSPLALEEGRSLGATWCSSLAQTEESCWNLTQEHSTQEGEPSCYNPQHPVCVHLRHRRNVLKRRGSSA